MENYKIGNLKYLQHIDRMKIGPRREPLMEHVKHCPGCRDCIMWQAVLKQKAELLDHQELAGGISRGQAYAMRTTHTIQYYYPEGDEIRNPDGSLNKNVYLKLKNVDRGGSEDKKGGGFTDPAIFQYFHINSGESGKFKHENFPEWRDKDKRTEYLDGDGYDAIKQYNEKYGEHKTTRVKRDLKFH